MVVLPTWPKMTEETSMKTTISIVPLLIAPALLVLAAPPASALPPRSERVTTRIAERAYARQAIAEARAERAGARVEAIAPVAPVPPPPRPATVRRMLRAGVPLEGIIAASQPPGAPRVVLVPLPSAAGAVGVEPAIVPPGPAAVTTTPPLARIPAPSPPRMLSALPKTRPAMPVAPVPETAAAASLEFPAQSPRPAVAESRDDIGADGTRSVLVGGEEPVAADGAPSAATGPEPIELLPVPSPR